MKLIAILCQIDSLLVLQILLTHVLLHFFISATWKIQRPELKTVDVCLQTADQNNAGHFFQNRMNYLSHVARKCCMKWSVMKMKKALKPHSVQFGFFIWTKWKGQKISLRIQKHAGWAPLFQRYSFLLQTSSLGVSYVFLQHFGYLNFEG